MDLALLVYAISTLGNIKIFLGILMVFCLILACCYAGNTTDTWKDKAVLEHYWKWAKRYTIVFVCIGAMQVVLPSQKTAYTMIGAYAAQKIAQDPKVEQMGSKVLTIINQKLDGYIEEGIDKVVEKSKK